ncbi:MAG: helix-turn-helix transcriptional regulator [Fimbriimonadaceae bacterium]|nr:helix-turn-helix transcriptional regulator [Fimbriimonadaceae bacterium]
MERILLSGGFVRPAFGPSLSLDGGRLGLPLSGGVCWQGWGGPTARHPARGLPRSLEVLLPRLDGALHGLTVVGAASLFCEGIPHGALCGEWIARSGPKTVRLEMRMGEHVVESTDLEPRKLTTSDRCAIRTIGLMDMVGLTVRVDVFDFPLSLGELDSLEFVTADAGASFVWSDVFLGMEKPLVCPFRGQGGSVSISEIATLVRMRDRERLDAAQEQLAHSLRRAGSLDEAKGLALTYLGTLCGALLESGAPRSFHLMQLEAARHLDAQKTLEDVVIAAIHHVQEALEGVLPSSDRNDDPIGRAQKWIGDHYAEEIEDEQIAEMVGLSTSHFRHRFRERAGQPFQKYLIGVRLEKAREMLLAGKMPVHCVARAVGFRSLPHFTRVFGQRFNVRPSEIKGTGSR